MFIRRKRSVQKSGEYEYLQIVESVRDGDKVRQKIIGTLGKSDKVLASGKIDALIRSLAQFAHHLKVVEASRTPDMQAVSSREWGPAMVFSSLWEEQGMPDLMRDLARVHSVLLELEGTRYQLRTTMQGASLHAFQAAGIRPPASLATLSPES